MAINKITAPLATSPSVFAAPVINHLNAHAINVNPIIKIANGYVKKGAMFCIGGELFVADADTAILGSSSGGIAVRFDVSGTTATATYVTESVTLTWNGSYHGWYDSSDIFYERLWMGNMASFNASPIPYSSVQLGITLPDSAAGASENTITETVKSTVDGMAYISLPLVYSSTEQNYLYTVEKYNGSTYDIIYTRTQTGATGDHYIPVKYGETYRFTIVRYSGLSLFIKYLGLAGVDPNLLRV